MLDWLKDIAARLAGLDKDDQPAALPAPLDDLLARRATLQRVVDALALQELRFGSLYGPDYVSVELCRNRQELAALDAEIFRLSNPRLAEAEERDSLIARLEASRTALRLNMFELEFQAARFGRQHTPAHIRAELLEKRRRLAALEVEIARLGLYPEL